MLAIKGAIATLTLKDPNGAYHIDADWVLAADGAHSPTRGMLGFRLSGENFEGRYAIADIRAAIDYPTARRAFFNPIHNPSRTVLVHRQPDNMWRIDYQLSPEETKEDALQEGSIRQNIEATLKKISHEDGYELDWWSVYTANTLALDDHQHGPVLFIGDSAHIVPIFGVRGLNNGLADAENIAWKLARVVKGEAGDGLLESYSVERRDATMDIFRNASKSTRFMTPPRDGWRLVRDAALPLSLKHDFMQKFASPRQMTPHMYDDSLLTIRNAEIFNAGPKPGSLIPNIALGGGCFLSDRLGSGFAAIVFGPASKGPLPASTDGLQFI
jgi:3-(3-hydroxy-phenyl)propionate hydroxylase